MTGYFTDRQLQELTDSVLHKQQDVFDRLISASFYEYKHTYIHVDTDSMIDEWLSNVVVPFTNVLVGNKQEDETIRLHSFYTSLEHWLLNNTTEVELTCILSNDAQIGLCVLTANNNIQLLKQANLKQLFSYIDDEGLLYGNFKIFNLLAYHKDNTVARYLVEQPIFAQLLLGVSIDETSNDPEPFETVWNCDNFIHYTFLVNSNDDFKDLVFDKIVEHFEALTVINLLSYGNKKYFQRMIEHPNFAQWDQQHAILETLFERNDNNAFLLHQLPTLFEKFPEHKCAIAVYFFKEHWREHTLESADIGVFELSPQELVEFAQEALKFCVKLEQNERMSEHKKQCTLDAIFCHFTPETVDLWNKTETAWQKNIKKMLKISLEDHPVFMQKRLNDVVERETAHKPQVGGKRKL